MTVWLIRGDCGDYYCGCGGGHVLAIASSESEANVLAEQARNRPRSPDKGFSKGKDFGRFSVTIDGPHEAGSLIDSTFVV